MTAGGPRQTLDAVPIPEEAHRQARTAAEHAGVVVKLVTDLPGLEAVEELINETWQNPTSEISLGMLRALSKSQNLVSGAYEGDRLLGACIAFTSVGKLPHLHSHLAAVRPQQRARGIGFALKLHQRAWALDRGITSVSWTFDPLVRRNARLNLARLGAEPVEYLPNFYGTRADAINATLPTDRLLVVWSLDAQRTRDACARVNTRLHTTELTRNGGRVILSTGDLHEPLASPDDDAELVLVELPEDITALRRTRLDVAERWRLALRDTVGVAMGQGYPVIGFTEEGHYVIHRKGAGAEAGSGAGR